MKALISKSADLNAKAPNGATALFLALLKNHTPIAQALLDAGADANTRNTDNATPLMTAVVRSNSAMVKALLAKGADVNVAGEGGVIALPLAEKVGDKEIIEMLKEARRKSKQ